MVLRFQEIVPLSTRNVLGPERNRVAMKWNSLIGATLNKCRRTEEKPREVKTEHHHKVYPMKQGGVDHVEFNCIISKQMVGILISVWVRKDLSGLIRSLCVSSVGCGIMGCLKNKVFVLLLGIYDDIYDCCCCYCEVIYDNLSKGLFFKVVFGARNESKVLG